LQSKNSIIINLIGLGEVDLEKVIKSCMSSKNPSGVRVQIETFFTYHLSGALIGDDKRDSTTLKIWSLRAKFYDNLTFFIAAECTD